MDNKITGVSLDTKIDGSENALDSGMAGSDTAHVGIFGQGAAATDALGEITIENYPSSPAIKEKKTTSLTSGGCRGNSANTGLWCGIGACFGFGWHSR